MPDLTPVSWSKGLGVDGIVGDNTWSKMAW
jgi:hypothetical protein